MRSLAAALLLCAGLAAESRLWVHDESGAFLREARAVIRTRGHVLVSREALYGAGSAVLIDEKGAMHRALWVTSDNPDLGVLELFVGVQAPPGPASSANEEPKTLKDPTHEAKLETVKEAGSTGIIGRLDCNHDVAATGPLYDSSGMLAGWHLVRVVDGKALSFAIPIARIEMESDKVLIDVAEWGRRHDAAREETYQRALGHFWAEDFDGALFYFRQAAARDSANARTWLHIGFAEGKQGRTKEKVACLKRAIELDPKLDTAHFYLGLQHVMSGLHGDAESELEELKGLESPYAPRLENLLRAIHVDRVEKSPKGAKPTHLRGVGKA